MTSLSLLLMCVGTFSWRSHGLVELKTICWRSHQQYADNPVSNIIIIDENCSFTRVWSTVL